MIWNPQWRSIQGRSAEAKVNGSRAGRRRFSRIHWPERRCHQTSGSLNCWQASTAPAATIKATSTASSQRSVPDERPSRLRLIRQGHRREILAPGGGCHRPAGSSYQMVARRSQTRSPRSILSLLHSDHYGSPSSAQGGCDDAWPMARFGLANCLDALDSPVMRYWNTPGSQVNARSPSAGRMGMRLIVCPFSETASTNAGVIAVQGRADRRRRTLNRRRCESGRGVTVMDFPSSANRTPPDVEAGPKSTSLPAVFARVGGVGPGLRRPEEHAAGLHRHRAKPDPRLSSPGPVNSRRGPFLGS